MALTAREETRVTDCDLGRCMNTKLRTNRWVQSQRCAERRPPS